jgi:hypothetical protein
MLFKNTVAVYNENYIKSTNTIYGKTLLLNIKLVHWSLKGSENASSKLYKNVKDKQWYWK